MTSAESHLRGWTAPTVWGGVPQRNKDFTGRGELLATLRQHVSESATALLPHALHGLGGVGKTQLAIEYAYRYAGDYQVVWWIPAEEPGLMQSSLAGLAPHLELAGASTGRVEDAVGAVLGALRRGEPYDRWLLIFDNADDLEPIRAYMPLVPGHVLVTSRNRAWARIVDALEVDIFTREESRQYLRHRVPEMAQGDADRLAEELGELPLALDHAASMMAETAMTVDTYLDLLGSEASRTLSEAPPPPDYPVPVAAAWRVSVTKLREQTPPASDLLRRCAFFGAAPIPVDLLARGRRVLGSPLQETLADPLLLSRAIRALGRYSLARIDSGRRTLEVHRIVQRLIRDDLDAETQANIRHEIHLLLAASDPGDPDNLDNSARYADLLPHIGPSEVVKCRTEEARRLTQNIARYLYNTGNYEAMLSSTDPALAQWTADSGEDEKYVLIMTRLQAQVLRGLGRYRESYDLTRNLLERMQTALGNSHEETLIVMNGRCVDLRARGDFAESLRLTSDSMERHTTAFGIDHPRTLAAMNNYAEDLELNGDYSAARELNGRIYERKRAHYVLDDHPIVLFTLNALARTMREQGYYAQARETAERAHEGFRRLVREGSLEEGHPAALQQAVDLAVARRCAGALPQGLELAQEAYERYTRVFGPDHPGTLAATATLGNARRVSGDLEGALSLTEDAVRRYRSVFDVDHPFALGCTVNQAAVYCRLGDPDTALPLLEEARGALGRRLHPHHHYALICSVNVATALAQRGEAAQAARLGEEVLSQFEGLLGSDHPHTLTCAANLAIDLRAAGQEDRATELIRDPVGRYRLLLGSGHPDVQAAAEGARLELGIELTPLF